MLRAVRAVAAVVASCSRPRRPRRRPGSTRRPSAAGHAVAPGLPAHRRPAAARAQRGAPARRGAPGVGLAGPGLERPHARRGGDRGAARSRPDASCTGYAPSRPRRSRRCSSGRRSAACRSTGPCRSTSRPACAPSRVPDENYRSGGKPDLGVVMRSTQWRNPYTVVHELGHALGLDHANTPRLPAAGAGVPPRRLLEHDGVRRRLRHHGHRPGHFGAFGLVALGSGPDHRRAAG